MEDFFSIKELGDLFGVSVQTLQYYDRIGLFPPTRRNEHNGYRMYKFDSVYGLATICYLKKLECSLEDIREYLEGRDHNDAIVSLKKRSRQLHRDYKKLMRIDAALRYKIEYIETNMKDMDVQRISIKSFPRRRYIPLGVEEMIYMDETFYFYPTLVFYRGENRLFGAEITDTLTKQDGEMEVLDIEEGEYLVGYHKGPYPAILSSIARVRSARPDLTLGETVITQNIIDQFVEKNSANYITEIQIPIL